MSAEILRRAAWKMMDLAGGTHQGPWSIEPGTEGGPWVQIFSAETLTRYAGADPVIARVRRGEQVEGMPEGYGVHQTPEHIAAWSPEIADMFADALMQHAELHDSYDCAHDPCSALDAARLYLGETS